MTLNRLIYLGKGARYFCIFFLFSLIAMGTCIAVDEIVDKGELASSITIVSAKAENATAGNEVGEYPQSAMDALYEAIDTAQTVLDNTDATAEEVKQAVTDLLEAEESFDAARITTVDKTELQATVTAVSAKAENATAGTEIGQYPQSAIDVLHEAIDMAKIVLNDTEATAEEVKLVVADLLEAEELFDAARITTEETMPVESVTDLKVTSIGSSWLNWSWINPNNEDFSHVLVYMNSTFATNTSESFYNATDLAEGVTYNISICTADIFGNISAAWANDSATTLQPPGIYNISGINVTQSSITLMWKAANDISLVQIGRDNITLGNVTGSSFYVDSNLSSGTTYNYTLIPYNMSAVQGNAVSVSLTTSSADTSTGGGGGGSSSRSSGGGGGGAGSGENYANVAFKDVGTQYVRMNTNVTYEFTRPGNDIRSVNFYALKNAGEIKSTIEVLHNRSRLVHSAPAGLVYRYINIWVGNAKFATEANIRDPRVQFQVSNAWMADMDVQPEDISLQRYDGNAWELLPVKSVNSTADYTVYESDVSGFSVFAITAEKAAASLAGTAAGTDTATGTAKGIPGGTDTTLAQGEIVTEQGPTDLSGVWLFFAGLLLLEAIALGYEYRKKKRNT